MIAWIFPGWEDEHPWELLSKYTVPPQQLVGSLVLATREIYRTYKDSKEVRAGTYLTISIQGSKNYFFRFGKVAAYSPTFVEWAHLARPTMFDVFLVTEDCEIHGTQEIIARFYDVESRGFRVLKNSTLKKLIPAVSKPEDRAFFDLFYASGMRRDKIKSLRHSDIDPKRGAFLVPP